MTPDAPMLDGTPGKSPPAAGSTISTGPIGAPRPGPCNVLLIYPKFNAGSFWNYRETCEIVGAKYPASPLGLITVAAMLPADWTARLVDRNVETLGEADLEWADMVMTGGMLPQQGDALEIIEMCRARGTPVVVGGPDVTSSPPVYDAADFKVHGEAESIIEAFLDAWRAGALGGTFAGPKFQADVTKSPVPRFDLLTFENYLHVGVQFSRGCPFNCEFCDIIELYGRMPRTKTAAQMLAELDALYALGYRGHVDFVDDNLIGNKKSVKAYLPTLIEWQRKKRFPFEFSTEASLNLSDDEKLMSLMRDAGFFSVFIGIESPDSAVLVMAQKKQNTKRDIAQSVHKIYENGLFVLAGFIVGFDNEGGSVAEPIVELIEEAAIPVAMVGLLYALPNTQLTRRLTMEGRLHPDHDIDVDDGSADQCLSGLNFDTKRPRGEVLRDYRQVVDTIYSPEKYFGRVARVGKMLRMAGGIWPLDLGHVWHDVKQVTRLIIAINVQKPELRLPFWKTMLGCLFTNPMATKSVLMMIALYVHLGPFSRYVTSQIAVKIDAVESGAWQPPVGHSEPAMVAAQ